MADTGADVFPSPACPAAGPAADAAASSGPKIEAIDLENHEFVVPCKEVANSEDMPKWENSQAYEDFVGFILAMNEAVKNKKIRDAVHTSTLTENLLKLLGILDGWVDEIPPVDQPQRFGNTAYRDWFAKLEDSAEDLVKTGLEEKFSRAVPEITPYLLDSFGNKTRIDYGTGHEMAFVSFLCCLFKIGAYQEDDAPAVVLKVFSRYLELVRKLLQTYRMEPAGSQGVWSLDDHQFIPFIWGSAQLLNHPKIHPKSFPNEDICAAFGKDYMFLSCIYYIHQVKRGPFAEHSNQLWNISGVPLWSKVNSGLVKMYKAEMLNKFPIIQHYLFGSLMSIKPVT